jgi:hypothetical protein
MAPQAITLFTTTLMLGILKARSSLVLQIITLSVFKFVKNNILSFCSVPKGKLLKNRPIFSEFVYIGTFQVLG